MTIRGTAVPAGKGCYYVEPRRVVGWDYGAVREVPAASTAPSPPQPESRAPSAEPAALPIRSAAMTAALRVAHNSAGDPLSEGDGSRFRCGSWSIAEGFTQRRLHRREPCATSMPTHGSPCCWVVSADRVMRTAYEYGLVPRQCAAYRQRSCSPGSPGATSWAQGSPLPSCAMSVCGAAGCATALRRGRPTW